MQKIFDYTLSLFILLIPIFTFNNYQPSFARGLFLVMGSFALFGISLMCEQKRSLSNIWIALFFLLALMRVFFDKNIGGGEWFNFWFSCAGFIYVFCGILLFRTVYCYADNLEQYIKPMIAVCVLNLILSVAQIFHYDFMWSHASPFNRIYGFMDTPAQLGQYSAMSIPALFAINPFLALIPLVTLTLSRSITPIVSLFAGLMFFGWQMKRRNLVIFLALLFVVLALSNQHYIKAKWYTRPIMWKATLSEALKKPYLGWGYQSFDEVVSKKHSAPTLITKPNAFNDYLHTAQELGFPILVVMGMFFINLFKKFGSIKRDPLSIYLATSVVIVLVNMGGQSLIRHASVSGTFIVLLALFCIQLEKENKDGCHRC